MGGSVRCYLFGCSCQQRPQTSQQTNSKCRTFCITIKPSLVRINKLDRDNLYLQILENLSFTYTANGKRQIQVESFSKQKMSRQKQLKTILMDKKLHETTNSCVEIMDSKRRETWLRGTNSRLPFDVNVMLNLSRSIFISASILKHAQRW